jgi:hypothetical protein
LKKFVQPTAGFLLSACCVTHLYGTKATEQIVKSDSLKMNHRAFIVPASPNFFKTLCTIHYFFNHYCLPSLILSRCHPGLEPGSPAHVGSFISTYASTKAPTFSKHFVSITKTQNFFSNFFKTLCCRHFSKPGIIFTAIVVTLKQPICEA